jgi:NADH-quinone oxidoreductase subunit B
MGIEERLPEQSVITTTLEKLVNWGRKYSIYPLTFGLACCAIEQIAGGASRFDIARFGSEVFRASPRQADCMIVSGRVSNKMAPVVKRLYDQMCEPKWVIAMGICASAGGPFNNYAVVQGVDKLIPVDIYVPGCPPRPEALFYAVTLLQKKIVTEKFSDRAQNRIVQEALAR